MTVVLTHPFKPLSFFYLFLLFLTRLSIFQNGGYPPTLILKIKNLQFLSCGLL